MPYRPGRRQTRGDRATVSVSDQTTLTDARGSTPVATTIDRLKVGQRVATHLREPVLMSDPVQASAAALVILADTAATPTAPAPEARVLDCGHETIGQPTGAVDPEARACIASAASTGAPAKFVSVAMTMEGDAIPRTVEVVGIRHVMLTVDTTQDRFGGTRSVATYRCSGAQLAPSPISPSRQELHVLGCVEHPEPCAIQ
jgi:hypothetical protein